MTKLTKSKKIHEKGNMSQRHVHRTNERTSQGSIFIKVKLFSEKNYSEALFHQSKSIHSLIISAPMDPFNILPLYLLWLSKCVARSSRARRERTFKATSTINLKFGQWGEKEETPPPGAMSAMCVVFLIITWSDVRAAYGRR